MFEPALNIMSPRLINNYFIDVELMAIYICIDNYNSVLVQNNAARDRIDCKIWSPRSYVWHT